MYLGFWVAREIPSVYNPTHVAEITRYSRRTFDDFEPEPDRVCGSEKLLDESLEPLGVPAIGYRRLPLFHGFQCFRPEAASRFAGPVHRLERAFECKSGRLC